ncbi:Zinc metalloproteinase nas-36 [Trichinella nativa]|uniref:Metalloendopeptidase n=2 Tax=Trichinella nativa TaxID=6335 RepID=A0A0V1L9Y8_9BILA|nr:Zinc metalloproteinase nas-36 [Trichinella nativa]
MECNWKLLYIVMTCEISPNTRSTCGGHLEILLCSNAYISSLQGPQKQLHCVILFCLPKKYRLQQIFHNFPMLFKTFTDFARLLLVLLIILSAIIPLFIDEYDDIVVNDEERDEEEQGELFITVMQSRIVPKLQVVRERAISERQTSQTNSSSKPSTTAANGGKAKTSRAFSVASASSPAFASLPVRFSSTRVVHLQPQVFHVNSNKESIAEWRSALLSSSLPTSLNHSRCLKNVPYSNNISKSSRDGGVGRVNTAKSAFTFAQSSLIIDGGGNNSPVTPHSPPQYTDSPRSASFTSAQSELDDIIIDEILSMEDDIQQNTRGSHPCSGNLEALLSEGRVQYSTRKVSSSAPSTSSLDADIFGHDDMIREQESMRDRRKKDIHNMIERRRRYNINDRIKELSTLLPKSCTEEMKLNKGSILKASVDYIRQLRKDQERLYQLLQKQMALEAENKRLSNRNQDLEEQMRLHGLLPDHTVGLDTIGLGSRSTYGGKQMKVESSLEGDYPFNVSPTSQFTCADYSSSSVLAGRGAGGQHSFLDRSSPCFRTTTPLSPDSAGSSDCAYTGLPLLHEQALFSAGVGGHGSVQADALVANHRDVSLRYCTELVHLEKLISSVMVTHARVFPYDLFNSDHLNHVKLALNKLMLLADQNFYPDKYTENEIISATENLDKTFLSNDAEKLQVNSEADLLFEGDILLTPVQANQILDDHMPFVKRKLLKRSLEKNLQKRWQGGVIKYRFHNSIAEENHALIRQALQFWQSHTCMRFVFDENANSEDHLLFFRGGGCYSMVGRYGGVQVVSIGSGCEYLGIISHEVGHAMGLWHQQSRPDADSYIRIRPENVMKGALYNFLKRNTNQVTTMDVPYDLGSVMHYGPTAFTRDYTQRTIVTLKPGYQRTIGQREHPSFLDVEIINRAYCEQSCPRKLPCQNGGYTHPRSCAECICPDGLGGIYCDRNERSQGAQCGGIISAPKFPEWFEITSPNYPNTYKDGQFCSWLIKADPGARITAEFVGPMEFFCSETCKDYVEVKNSSDLRPTGMRFCCTEKPVAPIWSDGNQMVIIFKTTSGYPHIGFKAKVQQYDFKMKPTTSSSTTQSVETTTEATILTTSTRVTVAPTVESWTPWSSWTHCSRTCGACGLQSRFRSCQTSTRICSGESYEHRRCETTPCTGYTECTKLLYLDMPCQTNGRRICSSAQWKTAKWTLLNMRRVISCPFTCDESCIYRHVEKVNCWHCHSLRDCISDPFFCRTCSFVQPPILCKNYFDFFGLEPSYNLDVSVLTSRFRSLQSRLHPDRFTQKSENERKFSEQQASLINDAYSTLLKPYPRAVYMLELMGEKISDGDERSTGVSSQFLMHIFELNEMLEDCEIESRSSLIALRQKVAADVEQCELSLIDEFDRKNVTEAKRLTIEMNMSLAVRIGKSGIRFVSQYPPLNRGRDWVIEGWWIRDHKPDSWPETAEQRKLAAMRYGLREEDYCPYPREMHVGNYPDLGRINYALKDPYENWSYPGMRRNFNEPVDFFHDVIFADRYTVTGVEYKSSWQKLVRLLQYIGGFVLFLYLTRFMIPTNEVPVKPKQYAYDYEWAFPYRDPKNFPLVHYTFEPED